MLKIIDFLHIDKTHLKNYKLHFAIGGKNKKEPLYALSNNTFKAWQDYQNNKNFERPFIVSLIFYKPDSWIFGGIYKRISVKSAYDKKRKKNYFNYKTELLPVHADLIGRAIFKFVKTFRQSYLCLENQYDDIILNELLVKQFKLEEFPGYENVIIDFTLLKEIINEEETTWKTALSNIKGVYVISDKSNGKQYVGSAYGQDAFWSRWCGYAKNGHGGNKELKALIDKHGVEYANNFQFSVLEIRSTTTSDDEIIRRESHWKKKLLTNEFGYNAN